MAEKQTGTITLPTQVIKADSASMATASTPGGMDMSKEGIFAELKRSEARTAALKRMMEQLEQQGK